MTQGTLRLDLRFQMNKGECYILINISISRNLCYCGVYLQCPNLTFLLCAIYINCVLLVLQTSIRVNPNGDED